MVGASHRVGHRLRGAGFPAPQETRRVGVAIVGGGIAGLSAAWRLQKRGYEDFALLELEAEVGGNSRSGENRISPYPWGAHYVPIPSNESTLVRELFEELGVIEGYDAGGLPIYNEQYLVSDPQERLLIHGHWQEGVVPQLGISEQDRAQYQSFFARMDQFKNARGSDGKPAFAIPLEASSQDPRYLALDGKTMAQFMDENGWTSEPLRWYVNYACRDDFGCRLDEVSAWAGIHYFASRTGMGANTGHQAVLTWPEGNGWLVRQLRSKVQAKLRPQALVFRVEERPEGSLEVDYVEVATNRAVRLVADRVIFAAPRFVAGRVLPDLASKPPAYLHAFGYAPWMVANITVQHPPAGSGAPLSWDNVSYLSPSLGYVVATHQRLAQYPQAETVLTYYLPLSETDPATARRMAIARSHGEWCDQIVADLSRMHPGIRNAITNLDVCIWGHAMIRPVPGFIWGRDRQAALQPHGRIHFAHSDMSGISLFEEAQYRGVMAADQTLAALATPRQA